MKAVIKQISPQDARRFAINHHYRKTLPRLNKFFLGWIIDDELVGIMTLGWGVQPLNTIQKLFPSLVTQDYLEIGRLCLLDDMPKNSESVFISECINYVKRKYPYVKLLYSWADGMLGKPGYVYQSSNFLYGGFSWTDAYFSEGGECVHPRTTNKFGGRLGIQNVAGIKHYFGKQFRYIYFLCSKGMQKRLLRETTVKWTRMYPKMNDLAWKAKVNGKIIPVGKPFYNSEINDFSDNAKNNLDWVRKNRPLTDFIAGEGSGASRRLSKLKGLVQFQYSALN